jgi:hypothetical protein
MTLTIEDVERLQQKLQADEQDYQLELQEGNTGVEASTLLGASLVEQVLTMNVESPWL